MAFHRYADIISSSPLGDRRMQAGEKKVQGAGIQPGGRWPDQTLGEIDVDRLLKYPLLSPLVGVRRRILRTGWQRLSWRRLHPISDVFSRNIAAR